MQVGCRLRCFRLTYSARCFSGPLAHFNDCSSNYCGLSGAWADKCLSCNKSPLRVAFQFDERERASASALQIQCQRVAAPAMIWFNAGGKGGGGQPGSVTAVQPAAICNLTVHSIHIYRAIWSSWGWEMLSRIFFNNRCATATLHVATLAHANATERQSHIRRTFANFVNVHAKQIYRGKAS